MNEKNKKPLKSLLIDFLNPVSDIKFFVKTAIKPNIDKVRNYLTSGNNNKDKKKPNWKEAVADAGVPIEKLDFNYRVKRGIWWSVMTISGVISLLLFVMIANSFGQLPLPVLIKSLTTLIVISLFSAVSFVQVMSMTYRLWQLREKRVSASEKGDFKSFWKESGGYISVLKPTYKKARQP
ncbi:conjugal transfer protein TraX [Dickeya undicola]|uniref:conjugal transfer protein TraX n=1 Tax=Dickeya undicola TaxID=1577887 RepID=UPI000532DCD3|nr:conjugal transfer protein TraX [Dickeya undicola]